ncbi:MAG: large subunit ribosomal protein, partial [Pseudonocardiales bacterium]|nr:large subunit ribosomal protein [Pseudonocardiales bacterium]
MTTATQEAGTTASLTVDVRTANGPSGRTVDLPADVFDVQVNIPLIHQVVVAQLAAARQGTHKTKTRAEVRGGGKKPYRQKGTGRARQGSIRSPQFAGGGVAHGPVPRDYSQRTPKKMKVAALRGALSDRARNGRVHVVDGLTGSEVPSTKLAIGLLAAISERKHVLVVAERTDATSWKSLRNVETVHLLAPGQLNTYDVLVSDDVVFTESALQVFLAGAPKGKTVKATATSSEVDAAPAAKAAPKKSVSPEPAEPATVVPAEAASTAPTPGEDLAPTQIDSTVPSVETAEVAPDSVAASADSTESADGTQSA